jgi:DNA repair protein RadC
MKKMKDTPRIDRPREKLIKYGVGRLSDEELLSLILGSGTKGTDVRVLSKKILHIFGDTLSSARTEELMKVEGLGLAKSSQIVALFELGRRQMKEKQSALVMSPQDVWNACRDIRESKKEHFVVFFLDTRNQEIKREVISIGTLNASLVHPREVFEPAISCAAAHILLVHNHPSGDCTPSEEDKKVTKQLKEAGELLGIHVLDHVIVSKNSFLSFREELYL